MRVRIRDVSTTFLSHHNTSLPGQLRAREKTRVGKCLLKGDGTDHSLQALARELACSQNDGLGDHNRQLPIPDRHKSTPMTPAKGEGFLNYPRHKVVSGRTRTGRKGCLSRCLNNNIRCSWHCKILPVLEHWHALKIGALRGRS